MSPQPFPSLDDPRMILLSATPHFASIRRRARHFVSQGIICGASTAGNARWEPARHCPGGLFFCGGETIPLLSAPAGAMNGVLRSCSGNGVTGCHITAPRGTPEPGGSGRESHAFPSRIPLSAAHAASSPSGSAPGLQAYAALSKDHHASGSDRSSSPVRGRVDRS